MQASDRGRSRSAAREIRRMTEHEASQTKGMTEHEASRTLVKSTPELWAECSDAASLARHLGEPFGSIRITRLEPETAVAWEGERASGTVRLEPSGWGTRVTLTAGVVAAQAQPPSPGRDGLQPSAPVRPLFAAAPPSAAATSSAPVHGVPPDSSAPGHGVPLDSSAPVHGVPPDSSAPGHGVPLDSSAPGHGLPLDSSAWACDLGPAPSASPPPPPREVAAPPDTAQPAELAPQFDPAPADELEPADARAKPARRGLFGRLRTRLRGPAPAQEQAPRVALDVPPQAPAEEPTLAQLAPAPPHGAEPAPAPAPQSATPQAAAPPPPSQPAVAPHVVVAPQAAAPPPPSQSATAPPAADAAIAGDELDAKAALTAALESLGKAHHRPYSRAGGRRRKT